MLLAFYSNRWGGFTNKVIRWWTSSWKAKLNGTWKDSFSHVELVFSDGKMFSASQYEKVVRLKDHSFTDKAWVRKKLQLSSAEEIVVRKWCEDAVNKGTEYDYRGVVGFILPIGEDSNKMFCSEACVLALQQVGWYEGVDSSKVSPNKLASLEGINIYTKGT